MPSITCSKCPATIQVDLPLSPNAIYLCSGHKARIEPQEDELAERCEICEARGCSVAFHSKIEIELKAFCRESVPSHYRAEEVEPEEEPEYYKIEDDYSEESGA